jgi:hypothetical protein
VKVGSAKWSSSFEPSVRPERIAAAATRLPSAAPDVPSLVNAGE